VTKLVVATGNPGKVKEFQAALAQTQWKLVPKPAEINVEETGNTFAENARLKASQVALATGEWAIADDSGLAVDALNGAPGVYSARLGATDRERIQNLLEQLTHESSREAQFVCVIAVASPNGTIALETYGVCPGAILEQPRGSGGFGYDPIFYLPDYQCTFAEMSLTLKQQVSHRGRALAKLLPQLQQLLLNL
jgi:XTP/dITP diphosphohydrolase